MRNLTLSFGVLVLLAIGQIPCLAQGPYRYLAQVAELNSPYQEKLLTELMRSAYPMTAYRVDVSQGTVEIGTADQLDRDRFSSELASYGLTLTAMYRQDRSNGFHRWLAVGPGNGFPTYQDTGDPIADQATYVAAKEAWYEDHAEPKNDLTKAGQ